MNPSSSNLSFSSDWIQQIPTSIALLDLNFNLVSASPSWLAKFDFQEAEIKNQNLFKLFPHFSKEWESRLKYCLEGLKDLRIVDHSKKGNLLWDLNPWKDGYGNTVGIILKMEPLEEVKELELELKKTKSLLDQKGKIAKIGSWEYLVQDNILNWSPSVHGIYGLSKSTLPNLEMVFSYYKKGHSRNTIKNCVKEAIEGGKPWNENLQVVRNDGRVIWVNSIGRPKFNEGKCVRLIGTIQDISESYSNTLTANPIISSDDSEIFEKIDIGLAIVDLKSTTILRINKKVLKLIGLKKNQIQGTSFYNYIDTVANATIKSVTSQISTDQSFDSIKLNLKLSNGDKLPIAVSGSLIKKDKKSKLVILTIKEVQLHNQKQNNLKSLLDKTEARNEQLINFAHVVSHNLKAHTTNFSLLLNFIDNETGENERKKLLNMLFVATENLTETIKGLREIVAIEENNISTKKTVLLLNNYIYKVEQSLFGILKKNDCKIINEVPENARVLAIPAYLESILTNCITNSIKYRQPDKNPIIILSTEETELHVVLNIEDNGLGIDMDKYGDKLFGLYKTFHNNNDAKGVGLYIVKKQIEALNGKVSVVSSPNEGATFKIFFRKS